MTKKLCLLIMQAAPVILFVGFVTILHLYAGNQFHRARETAALKGERRSISVAMTSSSKAVVRSVCFDEEESPYLEQFVDPLPILYHVNVSDGQQHVVKAFKTNQTFHRDLPPTTVYAFGTSLSKARVPGPALIAKRNVPTYIRWENNIEDDMHILPIDDTLTRAIPARGGVPIVPHLHGMESVSTYDGHPDAWFTKLGDTGSKYATQDYVYPNSVLPAMIWYHDHTLGITRANVVAGLAGPYIIRGDAKEEPVGLPHGDREILLVLQDKRFFADGSINFPNIGNDITAHPRWCPGYYGDTIVVNGKIWPYLDVLPWRYRLRILNAASDRYFSLSINDNMTFYKIGSDGGYLSAPVILDVITLSPAERVDCIVDFGGLPNGTRLVLKNSAPAPFPGGLPYLPQFDPAAGTSSILQFRVGETSSADTTTAPTDIILGANFGGNKTVFATPGGMRVRRFALTEVINNLGNGTELLLANRTWDDPATEFVPLTTTEVWEFIGLTPGFDHPIHIHLIKFQVVSVQLINVTAYEQKLCDVQMIYGHPDSCFLGVSRGPNKQELGWKDTVSAAYGAVTRIVIRFTSQNGGPFPFDATVGPGYIWHCHLLSHEDNSMMRPLFIKSADYKPDPDSFNATSGYTG